jgi:energy-coupling factor transport system ATP-binding protein
MLQDVGLVFSPGTPFEARALKDIDLEIEKNQIVAIIGRTGSGKSSLVQMIAGLQRPSSGTVLMDDLELYKKQTDRKLLRRKVGMAFQYPEHQLFEETVEKELSFGLLKQGYSQEEIEQRIKKAMSFTKLEDSMLPRSPFELSGGQMRRLAIASVIAMEPDYLILDEPTAGLDPAGRDEILGGLQAWQKETKKTVILVSHSMEDVAKLADFIIVLSDGQVVLADQTRNVFSQGELLQSVGLDVPQTTALMLELIKKGWKVPTYALTVQEAFEAILSQLREDSKDLPLGEIEKPKEVS